MEEPIKKKKYIKIEVKGKNEALWARIKDKFISKIYEILDYEINVKDKTTVKEEANELTYEAIHFLKEKLKQPGIENNKTRAEIDEIYSKSILNKAEAKKLLSETRKINAEAHELELRNQLNQIKIIMGIMKVICSSDNGEESIIFLKEIDSLIETIDAYQLKQ